MNKTLQTELTHEILRARERIYHIHKPTPFECVHIDGIDAAIYLKREDLSPINAYKWRGAYNAISMLSDKEKQKPIIAASAGNHAQGVALAVRMQGLKAKIYMPLSAPKMKQDAVRKHGGDAVEIILEGDSYSDTGVTALKVAKKEQAAFVHPFDNIHTIAGQATIADEIVLSGHGPFDFAFVQIGGGGMAAGVSSWLRIHYPDIKIIGVEGEGQAAMKASIDKNRIVTLDDVDTFCDGTAVKTPGKLTYRICRETLDDIITVTNDEVCAAIETTWAIGRFVPEPSGAMGVAGMIKYARANARAVKGKKIISIITGTNMDFSKLRMISANSAIGAHRRKYFRFPIGEEKGTLLNLLQKYFSDVNVTAFHYGKVAEDKAWPVIAFDAAPDKLKELAKTLKKEKVVYQDITGAADMSYRVINYDPRLCRNPLMLYVNFPERKGALRELLKVISGTANICYFNYVYTGEEIGRALMAFEFTSKTDHKGFVKLVESAGVSCKPADKATFERMFYFS